MGFGLRNVITEPLACGAGLFAYRENISGMWSMLPSRHWIVVYFSNMTGEINIFGSRSSSFNIEETAAVVRSWKFFSGVFSSSGVLTDLDLSSLRFKIDDVSYSLFSLEPVRAFESAMSTISLLLSSRLTTDSSEGNEGLVIMERDSERMSFKAELGSISASPFAKVEAVRWEKPYRGRKGARR